jgi:hypothetical protein
LYLGRVEVHCDDVVDAGHRQQICNHLELDTSNDLRDTFAYDCSSMASHSTLL